MGWLRRLSVWLLPLLLGSCIKLIKPRHEFTAANEPPVPDYALASNWAALPTTRDSADAVPLHTTLRDQQATAPADVFFLHLTTLILPKGWNADPADASLNQFTDKLSIMKQASVFNAAGRIYAPHYRQATLYAFFDSTANSSQALELAYQDVKASFRYYLAHYNQGRPIILAGHSQGAYHARRLLQEFFDDDPALRRQLVAAYLVGFEVRPERYKVLRPCQDSLQTGCYMSWNTAEWGYDYPPYHGAVVTNPLTWKTDTVTGPAVLNRGSVPASFDRIDTILTDAKVHNGVLWVHPPKASGYPRFLLPGRPELRHSFHLADYGLFYLNVRRNAVARVQAFTKQSPRP
ncbi:DUF3089 domain-containing protein [Hymenobacter canadensis]|uniref:DUF3089 domain-containing protein n=1 Tax=Hymenobacter canadensis TaxID=2999067 RepID=A0ABY7LNM5_9BACT|nr:DUF3089 domain-containing protein [Hymenobacter canadensis]WBA40493.1 DUF3089 domain-containing protein [Hymenobacter canadensis]